MPQGDRESRSQLQGRGGLRRRRPRLRDGRSTSRSAASRSPARCAARTLDGRIDLNRMQHRSCAAIGCSHNVARLAASDASNASPRRLLSSRRREPSSVVAARPPSRRAHAALVHLVGAAHARPAPATLSIASGSSRPRSRRCPIVIAPVLHASFGDLERRVARYAYAGRRASAAKGDGGQLAQTTSIAPASCAQHLQPAFASISSSRQSCKVCAPADVGISRAPARFSAHATGPGTRASRSVDFPLQLALPSCLPERGSAARLRVPAPAHADSGARKAWTARRAHCRVSVRDVGSGTVAGRQRQHVAPPSRQPAARS